MDDEVQGLPGAIGRSGPGIGAQLPPRDPEWPPRREMRERTERPVESGVRRRLRGLLERSRARPVAGPQSDLTPRAIVEQGGEQSIQDVDDQALPFPTAADEKQRPARRDEGPDRFRLLPCERHMGFTDHQEIEQAQIAGVSAVEPGERLPGGDGLRFVPSRSIQSEGKAGERALTGGGVRGMLGRGARLVVVDRPRLPRADLPMGTVEEHAVAASRDPPGHEPGGDQEKGETEQNPDVHEDGHGRARPRK